MSPWRRDRSEDNDKVIKQKQAQAELMDVVALLTAASQRLSNLAAELNVEAERRVAQHEESDDV
ncbi:MAG: hypothetical protein ACRDRY_24090 [Pseudonocardiaceae bacterium]